MAFIAVAIPVIVVAIGSSVYLQLGRNAQFDQYFTQAQDLARQADVQRGAFGVRHEFHRHLAVHSGGATNRRAHDAVPHSLDFVHVLSGGRIVRSGDKSLALELERSGYGWITGEAAA